MRRVAYHSHDGEPSSGLLRNTDLNAPADRQRLARPPAPRHALADHHRAETISAVGRVQQTPGEERNVHGLEIIRAHRLAGAARGQRLEAADHQAGPHQQHHGQRDLCRRQREGQCAAVERDVFES